MKTAVATTTKNGNDARAIWLLSPCSFLSPPTHLSKQTNKPRSAITIQVAADVSYKIYIL
jgi:hypothetical protein